MVAQFRPYRAISTRKRRAYGADEEETLPLPEVADRLEKALIPSQDHTLATVMLM